MQNPIVQKAVQVTKQTAAQMARTAAVQSKEVFDEAKRQMGAPTAEVVRPATQETPRVIEQIQEQGPTDIDRQTIAAQEKALFAQLQAKLARVRQERQQSLQQYNQEQQALMDTKQVAPAPVEAPQGKVSKAIGRAKKAITSFTDRISKKQETRGSGKG